MFEEDPWLPPQAIPRKHGSFAIPRMPTTPISRAAYVYGPGQQYSLLPNFYPSTLPIQASSQPAGPVTIQILYPLDIGYRHRSQVCLVEVLDGGTLVPGTKAVLRAYDPLYVRPDDLHTIPLPYASPSTPCPEPREISPSMALSNGSLRLPDAPSTVTLSAEDLHKIAKTEQLAFDDTYSSPEYADFSGLDSITRPNRGYLSPAQYTKSMFEKEMCAYKLLSSLQGNIIPTLYGDYHIEHRQREYLRDRIVYIALFEFVDGIPLSPCIISPLTDDEANSLWAVIQTSLSSIHGIGVVRRNRLLRKLLWNKGSSRLAWIDFSQSALVADLSVDDAIAGKDSDFAILFNRFEEAMNASFHQRM